MDAYSRTARSTQVDWVALGWPNLRATSRFGCSAFKFIGNRPVGVLVWTWIAVIIYGKALTYLHDSEHSAHFDRPELTEARHHRQRVVGHRHFHRAHFSHAGRPHRHVVRHDLADGFGQFFLLRANEISGVVAHGIHGVVRFMAVKGPVAGIVGNHINGADRADRHVYCRLRPLRR